MKEATKDLAYFQQQVAEQYDCRNWRELGINIELKADGVPYSLTQAIKEAAELYAAYRFEQGYNQALLDNSKPSDLSLIKDVPSYIKWHNDKRKKK